jgi:hypothetical protein
MDHIEEDESKNSSIVACVFVAAVTFLSSRFLATLGDYTYIRLDWWEYAADMSLGDMIYIPTFINTGSAFQKLMVGHTDRQHGDRISLLLFFFQNSECRLTKSGRWIMFKKSMSELI